MKPDEKSDDPEDAAAYKQARENMGDYKLKTANDFVVHDIQRVNTLRKKKELLLHRQMVTNHQHVSYSDSQYTLGQIN